MGRHITKYMTYKDLERYSVNLEKNRYRCNNCGHKVVIPFWRDKQLCHRCNIYVFKNKNDEDLYRVKEKIKWV